MNPIFRPFSRQLLALGLPLLTMLSGACASMHDRDLITRRAQNRETAELTAAPTDQKMMDKDNVGTVTLVDDFTTRGRKSAASKARHHAAVSQKADAYNRQNLLDR